MDIHQGIRSVSVMNFIRRYPWVRIFLSSLISLDNQTIVHILNLFGLYNMDTPLIRYFQDIWKILIPPRTHEEIRVCMDGSGDDSSLVDP